MLDTSRVYYILDSCGIAPLELMTFKVSAHLPVCLDPTDFGRGLFRTAFR